MAIVNATLTASHVFRSAFQEASYQFTGPSVAAGGGVSDDIRMAIDQGGEGKLIGVRVACNSEDFDISVRTEPDVTPPSVREILRVIDNDERYDGTTLGVFYWNPDGEDYLYLVLTNNDALNATGALSIELIISRM